MRAFHDSRDLRCRSPHGAVAPGDSVALWLDVWDAPGAQVALRTWVDGAGERRYGMSVSEEPPPDGALRYTTALTLNAPGIVWYHFIITLPDGREMRYGARDGRYGGEGQLRDGEPPSFPIAACAPGMDDELLALILQEADVVRRPPMKVALRYLRGEAAASELMEAVEVLRQTLPPRVFDRSFDILASYAQPHLFALLSGAREDAADQIKACELLKDPAKAGLAKGRLWCAALIQMLSVASLDFPHEADAEAESCEGAESKPRGDAGLLARDKDCEDIVRNASELHDILPVFREGELRCFAVNADVFGFWRRGNDGTAACVLVNASLRDGYDVAVPLVSEEASDLLGGYALPIVSLADAGELAVAFPETSRYAMAHLHPLGSAVLLFHPRERLQQPIPSGFGVLAHITSLPALDCESAAVGGMDGESADAESAESGGLGTGNAGTGNIGAGNIGAPARAFIDWLAEAGARCWQMLPVNPTDEYGSPYAGISAFAGNVNLLEGGLAAACAPDLPGENSREFHAFCVREREWLEPYVCFMAIRETHGPDVPWQDWPREYQRFDARLLESDAALAAPAQKWRRLQFAFQWQWERLRSHARERGVAIIGDIPLYVSADSADVWAQRELFQLDEGGWPLRVAGCPPDSFATEGQIWGNPPYDWEACKRTGYDWWVRRVKRALALFDYVRLDHFIGFARYFSIPAGDKASVGKYHPGPGLGLFQALHQACGALPFIAEDLGSISPCVRALDAACGFPGMDVVQFADGNDPLSGYAPRPGKVVYSGTHDNQTLRGYVRTRYPHLAASRAADSQIAAPQAADARNGAGGLAEEEAVKRLASLVAQAPAVLCVFALQDVLGLDDCARMNTPGTTEGNWMWQARAADIERAMPRLRELVILHEDAAAAARD